MNEGQDTDSGIQFQQNDNFDDWDDQPKKKPTGTGAKKQVTVAPVQGADGIAGLDNDYQVASLSWNCNGSNLAVAYGKTNHTSWCEHHSVLCVWSVFRRDVDSKKPTSTIEVTNCLTQVAWHPSDPVILAGGTINGEIYLWNVAQEEP